jgi:N-acetylglutamate synthase-like GNAT family acetyltransferase
MEKFREAGKKGKSVCSITNLTVVKDFEGNGAGDMFMRWGIERANAVSARCIVEAPLRGESFYAKHGFVALEHVGLVLPEKWKKYGTQEGRGRLFHLTFCIPSNSHIHEQYISMVRLLKASEANRLAL